MNDEEKKNNIKYIAVIILIILAAFGIPLFIDRVIFGNGFPSHITNGEWASFLGSFLGGIATMLSVVLTIRYTEKQRVRQELKREDEKRVEKRSYLDLICHWNATMEKLRDYESEKGKTIYYFKNEDAVHDHAHCTLLQLIDRSKYMIKDISIQLETMDQEENKHLYESSIPFIYPEELAFIVMPKATYVISGGRIVKELAESGSEKADETVKTITIRYLTEAGEKIVLVVTDGTQYSYSIQGIEILAYSCKTEGKYIVPKCK